MDVERFRGELRRAGVDELLDELLATFLQDVPARLAALEAAAHNGDAREIETAAHAFKSGAGTICAVSLADMLSRVEAAGRANRLESMGELMNEIRTEYLAVTRQLAGTHFP